MKGRSHFGALKQLNEDQWASAVRWQDNSLQVRSPGRMRYTWNKTHEQSFRSVRNKLVFSCIAWWVFFFVFFLNLIEELREKSNPGLTPRQVSDWQEGFSLRWAACGDMLKAQHACAELMALCVKRTFDGFTHQIATFYQLDSVWQQLTSMWTDSSYQPTQSNSAQRVWMWRLTLWWHYARKISRGL